MLQSDSFHGLTGQASTSSSDSQFVGFLQEKDLSGKIVNCRRLFADQELIVGRDGNRCHYVLEDPVISNKHVRIYSVVYNGDEPNDVAPLVYAEDLSRNGTFWNGSLIGKGNGGFLLSDGDTLRVSARKLFVYRTMVPHNDSHLFDLVQEHEMSHFRKKYIITDRILGSGAYGRVHMTIEQSQRTQLACKIVSLRKLQSPSPMKSGCWERPAPAEDVDSQLQLVKVKSWGQKQNKDNQLEEKLKTCYREAEILASLSHPNIIGLQKVYFTDNSIYIFQDLVSAGDLFSYVELKNGKLLEVEAAVIVRQILIALEFLHKKSIVHRDLKPENILMTTLASGCRVVLTDFGCARRVDCQRRRMLTCMGTYEYIAPEMPHERNLNATTGYTEAVDLWSLGCVTVVLLTGGYPFFDPESSKYSEKLARTRSKDFVRRLLVLDERRRMTAKEALTHEWFTNNVHKVDFEELYRRAIKHWRPHIPRDPVIELIEGDNLKKMSFLQGISPSCQRSSKGCPPPVDPPYKPFPRRLHTQVFFPKRRTSPFSNTMSDDVKAAIESRWNFKQRHSTGSSKENDLLMPCAFEASKGSDNTSIVESRGQCFLPSSASLTTMSKKSRFQPLRPNFSLMCTYPAKSSERNGSEPKSRGTELDCAEIKDNGMAPVRKAYSPTAWEREAEAMTSTPNSKAKLTLPKGPVAPRPPKALGYSKSGTDLSYASWEKVRIPRNSRCFPEKSALKVFEQSDQTVKPIHEEASLGEKHDLRSASFLPSSDRQMSADHPLHSILESIQSKAILNTELEEGAKCSYSTPRSLPAFLTKKDVPIDAVRPKMTIIAHRLNSPTHTIGNILQIRSSNGRKRRSLSIFDFEEDATGSAPGQSKKAKTGQENVKRDGKPTSINAVFLETRAEHGNTGSTSMYAQKIFDEANHANDPYLPRI